MANKQDYIAYISAINGTSGNGTDFFWKDYSVNYNDLTPSYTITNCANNSFSVPRNKIGNGIINQAFTTEQLFAYGQKLTVYLNDNGNGYTMNIPNMREYNACMCLYSAYGAYWFFVYDCNSTNGLYTDNNHRIPESTFWNDWVWPATYAQDWLLLEDAFTFLQTNFRNIIIMVDGDDWSDPTSYNWQSVPSISGKNGILSLTHVRNDSLLDGGSQTFTPDQVTVTEESRVGRIMANVPVDKAIKAIFSGVANYLGIHKDTSTTFTVIMQLVEHITRRIYLKSFVTDKCYIGFIMDTEQQAARVGIFYPRL